MENCLHKFKIFKNGFTLAEVLITLVIVGVVASLTISAVINTYVERSTIAKVKKGLSILGQAKKLAEVQNGSVEGWDFGAGWSSTTNAQFWSYLKPYISIVKDCGSSNGCYANEGVKTLSSGIYANFDSDSTYYKFILSDGSVMWFRTGGPSGAGKCSLPDGGVENVCALFWYDVNGDKKPNTFGKDVFLFEFGKDGVLPYIANTCDKNQSGSGCSGYIIKYNNMNYLH